MKLRSPFPYFGGKSGADEIVWQAFDPQIVNYIEPFGGSLAVLLGRPGGAGKIETVNDAFGAIPNFWRAVTYAPEDVARHCDWPVSELDLHAAHPWLIDRLVEMKERLRADRKYFDAEVAGWWLYGQCLWIGTGWCSEPNNHKRPLLDGIGKGINGINQRRLKKQIPMLSVTDGSAGRGVHSAAAASAFRLPSIGNDRGINGVDASPCLDWFLALQRRLRNVRIVCGDWRRVLGPSTLGKGKNVRGRKPTAIFFDPPYDPALRTKRVYAEDDPRVAQHVRKWCLAHGDDPDLRIALCGYYGEHAMPPSWTEFAWKGARGYAKEANKNRELERIWFSPHCLRIDDRQLDLFPSDSSRAPLTEPLG